MNLQEEIEYAHEHRGGSKLVRDYGFMFDVVLDATTTYTNLSLFWFDYARNKSLSEKEKWYAYNDLYLLALLHIDENDFNELKKGRLI